MTRIYVEGFDLLIDTLKNNGVPQEALLYIENTKRYNYLDLREDISIPGVEIQLVERYITSNNQITGYFCKLQPQFFYCLNLYFEQERNK